MSQPLTKTLSVMETAFERLEKQVPSPRAMPVLDGYDYRYAEKTIHQAMILKLARRISSLQAALILLDHGHVQEQGLLQRTLEEIDEDIMFLGRALTDDDMTDLHKRYLDAFFQEEFDVPGDPVASSQRRPMIPRKKIRAYLAKFTPPGLNPKKAKELFRTMHSTYSGFVHAAAPHILEMYGGSPSKFHLFGMLGTPRIKEYENDLWNYFYRGLLTCVWVAKSFGDHSLVDFLYERVDEFEAESGTSFRHDAKQ